MKLLGQFLTSLSLTLLAGLAVAAEPSSIPVIYDGAPQSNLRIIEDGQRPVVIHPTVEGARQARESFRNGAGNASTSGGNLSYHGGTGGIGVETAPHLYLVFWGSQWTNNDPSGEASILENFLNSIGGSSWFNSVTQYCQGVATGTVFCNGAGTPAGNQAGMLISFWYDNSATAPKSPSQSQIASEAVRAAQHFGNTTAASNASANYIIATSHGHNSRGFGTQYCAYHSSTSSTVGELAYTNAPYITDAGASCGANFNGLGANAGITIVIGHEVGEAATDQFPNGGWLDGSGSENGDKCAWISSGQGASADVTMPDGQTFPVQSLWSNAFNGGGGGCVLSF